MILEQKITTKLLCFVVNMVSVLPNDTLVKICCDFYDEKTIEAAKKEIYVYNKVSDGSVRRIRKGNNKNASNLNDIIAILHANDINVFLIYVIRYTECMPAIRKDCVSIANLMIDVNQMKRGYARVLDLSESMNQCLEMMSELQPWTKINR